MTAHIILIAALCILAVVVIGGIAWLNVLWYRDPPTEEEKEAIREDSQYW